ncbi:MAG: hypothetical protein ABJP89_19505 [Lentilitoribacter sp.]
MSTRKENVPSQRPKATVQPANANADHASLTTTPYGTLLKPDETIRTTVDHYYHDM